MSAPPTSTASTSAQVEDLVLLNNISDESILSNLRQRFESDQIYTSIGEVVVAVNPYKQLPIYGDNFVKCYLDSSRHELSPHIYAVAEAAFKDMKIFTRDQCVIISGESGSGKTEASKLFLNYIAAAVLHASEKDKALHLRENDIKSKSAGRVSIIENAENIQQVMKKLQHSNPCLEAFGNAKTTRNDNSSRFGKYMDIQFDFRGRAKGGHITTYLLEKSRVTSKSQGERSFHVFYQLLLCGDQALLDSLELKANPEAYAYLKSSKSSTSAASDQDHQADAATFKQVIESFHAIGITKDTWMYYLKVVAAIIHLGEVTFDETDCESLITNMEALRRVAQLLGLDKKKLAKCLTSRSVKDSKKSELATSSSAINVPLTRLQAIETRDALAKALYDNLFKRIVRNMNSLVETKKSTSKSDCVIGVLDIYGFEIMNDNGFEQFIINYCNEKLQQLFIELTLKTEQEEYKREGIDWTDISYFNNKTICELIEAKPTGIISLLDEQCVMPGNPSDASFLDKLNSLLSNHAHFDSRTKSVKDKTIDHSNFRLKHYAGNVDYNVDGFMEKNKDTLYWDVMDVAGAHLAESNASTTSNDSSNAQLKRPDTLATQCKTSMGKLVTNLMQKTPHYIRCIKPNNSKEPGLFDQELVLHQCRYLGLMENTRVRRAGFCFRLRYDKFVNRYKVLSPDLWPNPKHADMLANSVLILKQQGIHETEYKFGKTKLFIKNANSVFKLENPRTLMKHKMATKIRAAWLRYADRSIFLRVRELVIKVQAVWKGYRQLRIYQAERIAATVFSKNFKAVQVRRRYLKQLRLAPKHAAAFIQKCYRRRLVRFYLTEMSNRMKSHSKSWLSLVWPKPNCQNIKITLPLLIKHYNLIMAKHYRKNLSPGQKYLLEWKMMASDVFKTKEAFKQCAHVIFRRDHFDLAGKNNLAVAGLEKAEIDSVLSAIPVTKFHRSSLNKSVEEAIVLTDRGNLHLFEIPPSAKQNTSITTPWKLKQTIPIDTITGISLSQLSDGCFALSLPTDKKGDLILKSDLYAIEFASALCLAIKKKSAATGTDRKIDEFVTISNKITLKSTKNQRLQTLQFAKSGGVTNLTIKPTGGGSAAWMFSVPMIT